jgi:metal-sulfur cluster biosynthetic enzyme
MGCVCYVVFVQGAFLVKRDKERFRAALKDLKDYEIYKEVMEAAMVRMQQELEAYAEENAAIKATRTADDRQAKKHKE